MSSKKNICIIISNTDRFNYFEDMDTYLVKYHYNLNYILLNPGDSYIETYLINKGCNVKKYKLTSSKFNWILTGIKVWLYLLFTRPQIVHCHFYEANVIGLVAAWMAGIKNRIYTRHFSNLHHLFYPKGVVIDKFYNALATKIISISKSVTHVLEELESVNPSKIYFVPNGIDLASFDNVSDERIDKIYNTYQINKEKYIIGVVARIQELKGVQYVIPAFKKFHQIYPESIITFYNARGDYSTFYQLLRELPENSYRLIEFEYDMPAVYKTFDTFVHTPIDEHAEAFGLIYIEALAAGVPSIFTLSGVAHDFIEDEKNALVVRHKNSEDILNALVRLYEDNVVRERIIENNKRYIYPYSSEQSLNELKKLYDSIVLSDQNGNYSNPHQSQ